MKKFEPNPPPRTKPPTLKDLGDILGLSKRAVSQALHDRESTSKVSAETRDRVLKLAKTLGYRKNVAASSLVNQRTGMFGILCRTRLMHRQSTHLSMAVDTFHRMGIAPLVIHDEDRSGDERETILSALINARVDGVLLVNRSPNFTDPHVEELRRFGMSVVQVGSTMETNNILHFLPDRHGAFRSIIDHLAEQGYRKLGLLASTDSASKNPDSKASTGWQTRMAALEAVNHLNNAGTHLNLEIFETSQAAIPGPEIHPLYLPGYYAMREIIRTKRLPEVLVCQVDGWAFGAMRACAEAGIRIPEDLAMTGYGNDPVSSATYVPLTTAEEPFEEMCEAGIRELVQAVKENRQIERRRVVVPCLLKIRSSSVRSPEPGVSREGFPAGPPLPSHSSHFPTQSRS